MLRHAGGRFSHLPVVIVDYDPGWPTTTFEQLRDRMAATLGPWP